MRKGILSSRPRQLATLVKNLPQKKQKIITIINTYFFLSIVDFLQRYVQINQEYLLANQCKQCQQEEFLDNLLIINNDKKPLAKNFFGKNEPKQFYCLNIQNYNANEAVIRRCYPNGNLFGKSLHFQTLLYQILSIKPSQIKKSTSKKARDLKGLKQFWKVQEFISPQIFQDEETKQIQYNKDLLKNQKEIKRDDQIQKQISGDQHQEEFGSENFTNETIIASMIQKIQKLDPDKATSYIFSTKGVLDARGIIKFEQSGGTDEKIYLQKKGGFKHYKATSIIVDMGTPSHPYILTGIFPTLMHLVLCLKQENFPFQIKFFFNSLAITVKQISDEISTDSLINYFIKALQVSYNSDSSININTMFTAVQESSQVLKNYTVSKHKSIIILSNSLHFFRSLELVAKIQEIMQQNNIKVNFLTFVKYQKIWFKNVVWIKNFKSLGSIFQTFYDNGDRIQQIDNQEPLSSQNKQFQQLIQKLKNEFSMIKKQIYSQLITKIKKWVSIKKIKEKQTYYSSLFEYHTENEKQSMIEVDDKMQIQDIMQEKDKKKVGKKKTTQVQVTEGVNPLNFLLNLLGLTFCEEEEVEEINKQIQNYYNQNLKKKCIIAIKNNLIPFFIVTNFENINSLMVIILLQKSKHLYENEGIDKAEQFLKNAYIQTKNNNKQS